MTNYRIINRPFPPIDSREKVLGQFQYISDLRPSGMLWGQVVRSPYPHARVNRIEASKAMRVPGVRAIITSADTPVTRCGPFIPDWDILAREKVTFVGQEVAAVAALDPEAAMEAVRLVEVEYEELPAVFDVEKAIEPGAPLIHEEKEDNIAYTFYVDQGDVENAFKESDFVREGTFYTSSAFHAYVEPNGSIASYDPISGDFTLWVATQVPYKAWLLYSRALRIDCSKLRLIQAPMGGGFGGKFESNLHLVNLFLSKKAGRAVRLVNSFAEEFVTAPLRLSMKIHLKLGIKRDGTIMARQSEVIGDNGARTAYGPAVLMTTCYRVDNLYRIFNTRAKGYLVYTNNVPKGAMRGFGNPQMILAVESLLDMLAEDAGLDPADLRLKNTFKNGDVTVHGWVIGSCALDECIKKAKEASGWEGKKNRKLSRKEKKQGIGMACCNHVSGYRPVLQEFDGSSAFVRVGPEGKVTVFTGEVDIGQGYKTVAAQCAAEELGVPLESVAVAPVDSQTSVLGIGSLASRGTLMGGNAVKKAAEDVREKILRSAEKVLDKKPGSLQMIQGGIVDVTRDQILGSFKEIVTKLTNAQAGQPFLGEGHYVPDTVFPHPQSKYGNPSPAYSFGAHVAEVEVDTETGHVEIINYVAANDIGKAINPLMAKGQIEGGALMGIGWALTENLIVQNGKIVYTTLLDYKIPTFADMVNVVPILVEEEDPKGPYGAKSLGEAAFNPVAAAICNAIYDAVGVRVTRLPVLPETLLEAIRARDRGGSG
jgi:CO/xanthine dehydrogenase Mo-binding subunit